MPIKYVFNDRTSLHTGVCINNCFAFIHIRSVGLILPRETKISKMCFKSAVLYLDSCKNYAQFVCAWVCNVQQRTNMADTRLVVNVLGDNQTTSALDENIDFSKISLEDYRNVLKNAEREVNSVLTLIIQASLDGKLFILYI